MRESNSDVLGSSGLLSLPGVTDSISVPVLGKNYKLEAKVIVHADMFNVQGRTVPGHIKPGTVAHSRRELKQEC